MCVCMHFTDYSVQDVQVIGVEQPVEERERGNI